MDHSLKAYLVICGLAGPGKAEKVECLNNEIRERFIEITRIIMLGDAALRKHDMRNFKDAIVRYKR